MKVESVPKIKNYNRVSFTSNLSDKEKTARAKQCIGDLYKKIDQSLTEKDKVLFSDIDASLLKIQANTAEELKKSDERFGRFSGLVNRLQGTCDKIFKEGMSEQKQCLRQKEKRLEEISSRINEINKEIENLPSKIAQFEN